MEWTLDKSQPLSPQIGEQICLRIALGDYAAGQRLLSVRETALVAGVNPNTVQHAFETLEREGILYSVRGSGWYVTEDTSLAQAALERNRQEKTAAYFAAMAALGMTPQTVKTYVKEWDE